MTFHNIHIYPIASVVGELAVPGDKSISHRSIILGSLATGTTTVNGFLNGYDCLATIKAFQSMGVEIEGPTNGNVLIYGVGLHGLQSPLAEIDLGNSGTSMRLLTGLLACQSFNTTLIGDASLMQRPMVRVAEPLKKMGANVSLSEKGTPPIVIRRAQLLHGIHYVMPVASAQVKSALLLAGLYASGETRIIETKLTRDHTERMLKGFGVELQIQNGCVAIMGRQMLKATHVKIPGDISSAAFFIVAACIVPNSHLIIRNVGVNPTRTGIIDILLLMGAKISLINHHEVCGEPVADIEVITAPLTGIDIPKKLISIAIDEFPIIFIAAACASSGSTILREATELRVKESDRIHSMAVGLHTLGIACEEKPDGIIIHPGKLKGGEVDSYNDHRIAMAFCIAGLVASSPVSVANCNNITTSFPNFVESLESLSISCKVD